MDMTSKSKSESLVNHQLSTKIVLFLGSGDPTAALLLYSRLWVDIQTNGAITTPYPELISARPLWHYIILATLSIPLIR